MDQREGQRRETGAPAAVGVNVEPLCLRGRRRLRSVGGELCLRFRQTASQRVRERRAGAAVEGEGEIFEGHLGRFVEDRRQPARLSIRLHVALQSDPHSIARRFGGKEDPELPPGFRPLSRFGGTEIDLAGQRAVWDTGRIDRDRPDLRARGAFDRVVRAEPDLRVAAPFQPVRRGGVQRHPFGQ